MTSIVDVLRYIDGRGEIMVRPVDAIGLGVPLIFDKTPTKEELESRLFDLEPATLASLILNRNHLSIMLDWLAVHFYGGYTALRFSRSDIFVYRSSRIPPEIVGL